MSEGSGRFLGLDLGSVRIGVALSDALGMTAQPVGPLPRVGPRRDIERLREIVAEHGVVRVVVGHPLTLSGEEGQAAVAARDFSERLGARLEAIPVVLWDERLTTVQAERTMIAGGVRRAKRREKIDALAAVLILQSYMDAQGAGGAGIG